MSAIMIARIIIFGEIIQTNSIMKKTAKSKIPKDVDSYLAKVPPKDRAALEKIRKTIKAAAPKSEEIISYQIPCYKYHGPLVFFAAFPNHLSLYAIGKKLLKELAAELKPFEIKGTTIHFSTANPLPAKLVKKIVKERIKENVLRKSKKQKAEGKNVRRQT